MKELMEYFKNRPQTWEQRRRELQDNYQIGWADTGPLPRFITLLSTEKEQSFLEAKKITNDTTLALSEERYSDCPNYGPVYLIGEMENKSEFWHIFYHFEGNSHHECDARCAIYDLPTFVARR